VHIFHQARTHTFLEGIGGGGGYGVLLVCLLLACLFVSLADATSAARAPADAGRASYRATAGRSSPSACSARCASTTSTSPRRATSTPPARSRRRPAARRRTSRLPSAAAALAARTPARRPCRSDTPPRVAAPVVATGAEGGYVAIRMAHMRAHWSLSLDAAGCTSASAERGAAAVTARLSEHMSNNRIVCSLTRGVFAASDGTRARLPMM
jgi:hypothetical protein